MSARGDAATRHIQAAQIRLLYDNADAAVAVTLLVSAALCYLQGEVIPRFTLLAWLAYMAVVSIMRFALARGYYRLGTQAGSARWWSMAFTAGTGLAGMGWGAAGILLYPAGDVGHQVFLVFVLGGMMLGGGAILAGRPQAFLAFLLPTGLPIALRLLFDGDNDHLVMGLLMALLTAATLLTTFHVHQAVTASLALRHENDGLVADLKVAAQRLEGVNQELETRVAQRTAELDQTVSRLQGEIAERRRAEQQRAALEARLRHAQKLEAIGVLSAGIAHEFNNLLTTIAGYTTLVRDSLPGDADAKENLAEVLKAGDRAASLVRRLLVFSRKTEHRPKRIDAAGAVSEALELVRSSLPSSITIRSVIDPRSGAIFADPNLIQQIVINLCANAGDAMAGQLGLLEVTLAPVDLRAAAASQQGLADGPFVKLTIRDTGRGISSEIGERVFEPFFTTKAAGTAAGLGLSVVYGIVETYGGRISFESRSSEGTRFTVFLPRLPAVERIAPEATEAIPVPPQRILLVDDEAPIVRLATLMLRGLGHRVTALTSATEVWHVFRTEPDSFDLLITDLTMPQITGRELIRKLREIRPGLPVILMSGFNDATAPPDDAHPESVSEFLPKPFSRCTIEEAIRRLFLKKSTSCPQI